MAEPTAKTPPTPQPIDWDVTEFVRNPGGAILDINKDHVGAQDAALGRNGWRLATLKEAKAYCEANNIDPAGLDNYEKHVKDLQKAAEAPVVEEAAAAGEEPGPKITITKAK